jgi:hypothetical protein
MAKVIVNITWPGPKPSLDDIRAQFGLSKGTLDETFGVIATRPGKQVYTVLLDDREMPKLSAGPHPHNVAEPRPRDPSDAES